MLPYWRLSAHYFFYFAFIGTFSPYFGLYLRSLGFGAWDIGVLMSLLQVMRLVAPMMWSSLACRLQAHVPIMRLASLLSVIGFSGLLFTDRFAGIFVSLSILAFFWTASLPLIETLTLAHLGPHTSRYGSIRLWGSVGFVAAVLGVGYVLDLYATSLLVPISCGLLGGILITSLFMPEARVVQPASPPTRLREIIKRREVKHFLAASFFMSAAHGALYVFYSIHLVNAGYSKAVVGWLWTLGVLAEIVLFFYMAQMFQRFPVRTILLASFGCACVRFALIGWGVGWWPALVFAQILHGATFGAHHAAAMAMINRWFGAHQQARGQALYGSVSFGAGGMVGGVLSGWLWEVVGPAWTFTLGSMFGAIGMWLIYRCRNEVEQ